MHRSEGATACLQLFVKLIEATGVPRMDLLSKSDPYVSLYVRDKNIYKSQVKENNHHPVWNEEFKFLVHEPDYQAGPSCTKPTCNSLRVSWPYTAGQLACRAPCTASTAECTWPADLAALHASCLHVGRDSGASR